MSVLALLFVLLAVTAILNLVATSAVFKSDLYEARQKYMQYAFIWLVPILGAGTALAISRQTDIPRGHRRGAGDLVFDDLGMFGADLRDDGYAGEGHDHVGGHDYSGGDHG